MGQPNLELLRTETLEREVAALRARVEKLEAEELGRRELRQGLEKPLASPEPPMTTVDPLWGRTR